MLQGRIVGTATATVRHPSMQGWKLLVMQPLTADGHSPDGDPFLVVDNLGAGLGDRVFVTSDGRGTREMLQSETSPVRWHVMGIVD